MRKLTSAACFLLLLYATWAWTLDPLFVGLFVMLLYDFTEKAVQDDQE